MKLIAGLCVLLAEGWVMDAQQSMLPAPDALELCRRVVSLMESTTVTVPELVRAGAPILENTRQSLLTLERVAAQQHSGLTYTFLKNARAYLALADSVTKPYPFPPEASRQFAELRDSVDRLESYFRALLDQKELALRSPDRDNLTRHAEANNRLTPASARRVVFLGDSITDFWRLNEYFGSRDFVNRGISGQVTGEMLGRMKADVLDLKPKAVLILAGTNDIGRGVPLSTILNNLSMIADLADAHRVKAGFASLLPVSDYHKAASPMYEHSILRPPARIVELNRAIEKFCRQRGFEFVDYYSAVVDKTGFLRADASDDGLHPNAAGYRLMAPVALAAADKLAPPAPVAPPAAKRKGR